MAASVQFRPQNRDLGTVMREVDEDLAIFLGMRNDDFNCSNGAKPEPEAVSAVSDDNFLKMEIERSDYDRLLSQADTSLLPSEETNPQDTAVKNHYQISNGDGVPLKPESDNTVEESAPRSTCADSSSAAGNRKPTRRAATPTGRPILREKSKPVRASTPTPRTTLPSSKPMAAQARFSTPASGPSVVSGSKSAARPATPTSTPITASASSQLSSGRKTATQVSNNPVSSRGTSPTVKSRPSKPSEMLSLSHDGSQNLKPSVVKRPVSASRGRPTAPVTQSASSKPRQKSCSPAKVRGPTKTGSKMLSRNRGYNSGNGDDVNPVLMGTKMVNRVVNMRKLAPPKQDEYVSHDNQRKYSHENSGFGRSLSKSSLDMAIRHMDIGRSIGDNLCHVATSSVLSSARSIQSGSSKGNGISVLESPPSSSCDSSKSSICINSHFHEVDY